MPYPTGAENFRSFFGRIKKAKKPFRRWVKFLTPSKKIWTLKNANYIDFASKIGMCYEIYSLINKYLCNFVTSYVKLHNWCYQNFRQTPQLLPAKILDLCLEKLPATWTFQFPHFGLILLLKLKYDLEKQTLFSNQYFWVVL